MFQGGKGAGGPFRIGTASDLAKGKALPASQDSGFTDESGALALAGAEPAEVDMVVRERAREIASRLSIRQPRGDRLARRGRGKLTSVPYRGGSDEIDLDRTIEVLAERPVPDEEDIIVVDRVHTRRSVVLAIDVSGSMKGERIRTAAATVGALAGELIEDAMAVIAFWSDAAILLELGQPIKPDDILDDMLRLPARGLTNIAFPLELAARQLELVPARESHVILLSDCMHNAGPDPRIAAARLARLDVLIDLTGEKDIDLGRDLGRVGHGTTHVVRSYRDVAPALELIFAKH